MAPTQTASLLHILKPRADDNDDKFNATPSEAVIVPVAILIVLLISAATISVYRHWRRRKDHDQLIKASSSRKPIPDWLSIWIDPPRTKPVGAGSETRGSDFDRDDTIKPSNFTNADKDNHSQNLNPGPSPVLDSDTIALRPISVFLPAYPLTVHDPCDRYPHVANYGKANDLRPKVMGVPLR